MAPRLQLTQLQSSMMSFLPWAETQHQRSMMEKTEVLNSTIMIHTESFFGWDENYADANMVALAVWVLYNATNTSEVYSDNDAPLIAGNLRLTTNTSSTWKTPTTGTLVVTGGAGISENLNVGGTTHLNGNVEIDGTLDIDANFAIRDGSTDKFTIAVLRVILLLKALDVQWKLKVQITYCKADNKVFDIKTDAGVSNLCDTDNGNTVIEGTVNVSKALTLIAHLMSIVM